MGKVEETVNDPSHNAGGFSCHRWPTRDVKLVTQKKATLQSLLHHDLLFLDPLEERARAAS